MLREACQFHIIHNTNGNLYWLNGNSDKTASEITIRKLSSSGIYESYNVLCAKFDTRYNTSLRDPMQIINVFLLGMSILLLTLTSCSVQSDLTSRDEYRYDKARAQYENENYLTAITLYNSVIDEMPWSKKVDECHYYIGKSQLELSSDDSLYREDFLQSALNSFNTVGSFSSVWVKAQYEIGYTYYELSSMSSAKEYLSSVYQDYPQSSRADDALLILAHIEILAGDRESGLRKYREILKTYSDGNKFDNALYHIAETHLYTAEDTINDFVVEPEFLQFAIDTFQLIEESSSLWDNAQFDIGYCLYKAELYDSAQAQFRTLYDSLKSSSRIDNAALYIGHSYRKQDLPNEALIWYLQVIEEFPTKNAYDNALYWAGDYYYDRKHSADSEVQESNRMKAVLYFSRFCEVTDKTSEKYHVALGKLENLGVE